MTPEDFKAAMQADKDATRAKWQGMVDEVFGPREVVQYVVNITPDMAEVYEAINKAAREHGINTGPHTVDADAAFWAKVPEGFDWVAMDALGCCLAFNFSPTKAVIAWPYQHPDPDAWQRIKPNDNYHPRDDWQNSLRRRPEGL